MPGNLGGQTNANGRTWSTLSTGDDVTVGGSSLTIPGFAPSDSKGKSVTYQGNGVSDRLALASFITSGSAYYSLAVKVTDYGSLLDSPFGVFIAGFNNSTGASGSQATVIGTRLLVRPGTNPNTYQIGMVKNSSDALDFQFDLTDHPLGETVFVVGRYTIAATDTSALWINPGFNTLGAGSAPTPTLTSSAGSDMANGVRSFLLRQGQDNIPFVTLDELRVDPTWAGATSIPEPCGLTTLLITLGCSYLAGRSPVRATPAAQS